jgi:hypothetical protein
MNRVRRPFWLPAANYYVLAFAIALAFFFVVWGVVDDVDGMRAPWQAAGVGASILLMGAAILRELILVRSRAFLKQPVPMRANDRSKLTIDRAAAILGEIKRKSEAANILDRVASGHREVFQMCAAFVQRIDLELATVQAGSPRLATLLKSRTKASELHRFHTLRWAEIGARELSGDARSLPEPTARVRAASQAVAMLEEALVAYPAERSLIESRAVLNELVVSIKVANAVEEAERAALGGNTADARGLYQDALVHLGDRAARTPERNHAETKIREAIDRL